MKSVFSLFSAGLLLCSAHGANILSEQWFFVPGSDVPANWSGEQLKGGKPFKLDANLRIDLDSVAGKEGSVRDMCVVYQEFELDEMQEISFGAGANWWFDVYLNGQFIYSTTEKGNGSGVFCAADHFFRAMGKKGKNYLAIQVRRGVYNWSFAFAERSVAIASMSKPVTLTVDTSKKLGNIKIMNAINNAPVRGSGWNPEASGNMAAWQALKIPYGRTHDAAFASAYGGEFTVDVHRIFTDFSKDPYDPANYDFASTDMYVKLIEDGGTKVFYRLGATIEHTLKKYGTRVPADFKKWAVICEHIIRHYTEGWANGFKMDIEYWEIWNEPDLKRNPSPTWQGTPEQFYELYRTTALHLKKCFPKLKIGGPAMAGGGDSWMRGFLKAMTTGERVPLDFFSWHCYSASVNNLIIKAERVRALLDEFGYHKTESILNEWNYVRSFKDLGHAVAVIRSIKGAAYTASVMSSCQSSNTVDMLMYYDGRPCSWNGLFGGGYQKLKTYYVFLAWSKLRELGTQIHVDTPADLGLNVVAASDGKKVGIMLSRFFETETLPGEQKVRIKVPGVDLRGVRVYMIDEDNDFTDSPYWMTAEGDLIISMKAHSVVYIEK